MRVAPASSPRLWQPGTPPPGGPLIDAIHQLEREHAFALSDATDCEQETTIGVILTGNRVKFVIPGGPGHRPAVGHALQIHDVVLSVDHELVDSTSVVDRVRGAAGANRAGSRVTLKVKRSGSGSLDTVVCIRAPLNFVQHSMDLHAVLADGTKSQHQATASLAARVQEQVQQMEDNNHATQQRLNGTIARLLAMSVQDDAASKHSTPNRSILGSAEEVDRLKKELGAASAKAIKEGEDATRKTKSLQHKLDSERQKAADLLALVLQNTIAGSDKDSDKKPEDALSKALNKALSERILLVGGLNTALRSLSLSVCLSFSFSLPLPPSPSSSLPPSLLQRQDVKTLNVYLSIEKERAQKSAQEVDAKSKAAAVQAQDQIKMTQQACTINVLPTLRIYIAVVF